MTGFFIRMRIGKTLVLLYLEMNCPFCNTLIENAVFLGGTLGNTLFPRRQKNLASGESPGIGGLKGVFKTIEVSLYPALAVTGETDLLHGLLPLLLFIRVNQILAYGRTGQFCGERESGAVSDRCGIGGEGMGVRIDESEQSLVETVVHPVGALCHGRTI